MRRLIDNYSSDAVVAVFTRIKNRNTAYNDAVTTIRRNFLVRGRRSLLLLFVLVLMTISLVLSIRRTIADRYCGRAGAWRWRLTFCSRRRRRGRARRSPIVDVFARTTRSSLKKRKKFLIINWFVQKIKKRVNVPFVNWLVESESLACWVEVCGWTPLVFFDVGARSDCLKN